MMRRFSPIPECLLESPPSLTGKRLRKEFIRFCTINKRKGSEKLIFKMEVSAYRPVILVGVQLLIILCAHALIISIEDDG